MKTATNSELEVLQNEIKLLKNTISSMKQAYAVLEEQLEWFKRQIFGKKSERIVKDINEKH